ncbi:MAG TPA: glycosyltransferase family 2 protein [Polyangiaceae bacterium]|jgi:glycosyltransferase involved in cell wall biosynthesis|nr:glycosyltransferase family 2 protein [Polyangiaceae bacterium]
MATWLGADGPAVRVVAVVPAWEEAPRIARVVASMPAWVDAIVVVDDASTDGTAEAARGSGDERVRVVRHPVNRGVGAAIATGYRCALSMPGGPRDAFVVMAGDGQMDPEDLPAVVAPITRGEADYVKGDRFRRADTARAMPHARRLGGRVFSWATARAIGVPISDSQCGYTAITRAACARLDLDALWPRYGYPNDLLSQLAVRGLRIAEVPVRAVYADEVSRLTLRHVPVVAGLIARAAVRRHVARFG